MKFIFLSTTTPTTLAHAAGEQIFKFSCMKFDQVLQHGCMVTLSKDGIERLSCFREIYYLSVVALTNLSHDTKERAFKISYRRFY